jgi:hypothetical protein
MPAEVSAQAQSRFPAYARRTTPAPSPARHRTFRAPLPGRLSGEPGGSLRGRVRSTLAATARMPGASPDVGAGLRPAPHIPATGCTVPAQAQRPRVRGAVRRDSVPVPPPACADALAPRRLRVPDLTPSTRQESEVRNLRLYYTSKQTKEETNPKRTGGTPGTPPAPKNTARCRVAPDPYSCLPQKQRRTRRTYDRGKRRAPVPVRACRTRKPASIAGGARPGNSRPCHHAPTRPDDSETLGVQKCRRLPPGAGRALQVKGDQFGMQASLAGVGCGRRGDSGARRRGGRGGCVHRGGCV